MVYEGKNITVGFNPEWVASQKLEAFLEHEKHHNLSQKELKEVYKLCQKQAKEVHTAGEPDDIQEKPAQ